MSSGFVQRSGYFAGMRSALGQLRRTHLSISLPVFTWKRTSDQHALSADQAARHVLRAAPFAEHALSALACVLAATRTGAAVFFCAETAAVLPLARFAATCTGREVPFALASGPVRRSATRDTVSTRG